MNPVTALSRKEEIGGKHFIIQIFSYYFLLFKILASLLLVSYQFFEAKQLKLIFLLLEAIGGSSGVEQLAKYPKFEGLKPAATVSEKEEIAYKHYFIKSFFDVLFFLASSLLVSHQRCQF